MTCAQVGSRLPQIRPIVMPQVVAHGDDRDLVQPPFNSLEIRVPNLCVDGEQCVDASQEAFDRGSYIFLISPINYRMFFDNCRHVALLEAFCWHLYSQHHFLK